jgi:hypothetical protein
MNEQAGRARVWNQGGDDPEVVQVCHHAQPPTTRLLEWMPASRLRRRSLRGAVAAAADSLTRWALAPQEAIDSCPVNCISYVDHEDLVILENERLGITINPMSMGIPATWSARMNGIPPSKAKGGGVAMTCNNCPSRGCKECPMCEASPSPSPLTLTLNLTLTRAWL